MFQCLRVRNLGLALAAVSHFSERELRGTRAGDASHPASHRGNVPTPADAHVPGLSTMTADRFGLEPPLQGVGASASPGSSLRYRSGPGRSRVEPTPEDPRARSGWGQPELAAGPHSPPQAAAVFRWAGSATRHADRIVDTGLRLTDRLHNDLVLPAVAEVVIPSHLRTNSWQHVADTEPTFV